MRSTVPAERRARSALLAGASGLVGRQLLRTLETSPDYERVHVLARRPLTMPLAAKVHVDIGEMADARAVPRVDDVYLALGSTIRQAGSQAAFRQVDFDLVVHVAALARLAGARRLAIVSALGADPHSRNFYSRVKGEMEAALRELSYETLVIARPSLLAGDREVLGQAPRPIERWSLRLSRPIARWLPATVRPVGAEAVAIGMVHELLQGRPGEQALDSRRLQTHADGG